jgi:hypothetical protein
MTVKGKPITSTNTMMNAPDIDIILLCSEDLARLSEASPRHDTHASFVGPWGNERGSSDAIVRVEVTAICAISTGPAILKAGVAETSGLASMPIQRHQAFGEPIGQRHQLGRRGPELDHFVPATPSTWGFWPGSENRKYSAVGSGREWRGEEREQGETGRALVGQT